MTDHNTRTTDRLDTWTNVGVLVSTRRFRFSLVRDESEGPEYNRRVVLGSSDVAAIARAIIGSEAVEVLLAVMLDSRNRVMGMK